MKTLGTIIYKLLFENSPLGAALKKVLEFICQVVEWMIQDVWKGFFCPLAERILPPMLNAVVGFLKFIQSIIDAINRIACGLNSCLPASASVQGAVDSVNAFKRHIESGGLGCDKKAEKVCFLSVDEDPPNPALPVATR